MLDIAAQTCADKKVSPEDEQEITHLAENRDFARLAQKLGVRVIHCSERDTQVANRAKEVNEFVGTWSIEGLREEGTAPVEIAWGTHENKFPPLAHTPPYGRITSYNVCYTKLLRTSLHSYPPLSLFEIYSRTLTS